MESLPVKHIPYFDLADIIASIESKGLITDWKSASVKDKEKAAKVFLMSEMMIDVSDDQKPSIVQSCLQNIKYLMFKRKESERIENLLRDKTVEYVKSLNRNLHTAGKKEVESYLNTYIHNSVPVFRHYDKLADNDHLFSFLVDHILETTKNLEKSMTDRLNGVPITVEFFDSDDGGEENVVLLMVYPKYKPKGVLSLLVHLSFDVVSTITEGHNKSMRVMASFPVASVDYFGVID